MPKPSDYTPQRRRIMQGVMWAILAGTIALAALVSRAARRANIIEWSAQPVTVGDVTVRVPIKWRTLPRAPEDSRTVMQAVEPGDDDGEDSRVVSVMCEQLSAPVSPLQYLHDSLGAPVMEGPGASDEPTLLTTMTMVGRTGVLFRTDSSAMARGSSRAPHRDVWCCAILPSLRAVAVHLRGIGDSPSRDVTIARQIANSILVTNEPKLGDAAETITLAEGIRLNVPDGFALAEEKDALRSGRRLWSVYAAKKERSAREFESEWTTIDLTGCLVPPADNDDATQAPKIRAALATILNSRDPMWRNAVIASDGPNVWHADTITSIAADNVIVPFPCRAYLLTDRSGQALLAIYRGGLDGPSFDADFKSLASTVKFTASGMDLAHLEDVGAAEASRIKKEGFERLIDDRNEQWWIWQAASGEHPHLGWTHVDLNVGQLSGKTETRWRRRGNGVTRITSDFSYRDSDGRYRNDSIRADLAGETPQSIQQTTSMTGAQLNLTLRRPAGSISPIQNKVAVPPQFIPGALLPLILSKLGTEPMLIRTESFPGCEAAGVSEPLTVLIRPSPNATRKAEGETKPMRCLTAQVNASGETSRWFFRQSGELECIELPGGVLGVEANPDTIRADFGNSGPMTP